MGVGRRARGLFAASNDTLCGSLVRGLWRDGDSPTWCLEGVSSSCPWEGLGRATQTSCGSADTREVGGSGFPPQSRQTGGAGRAGVRVSQWGRGMEVSRLAKVGTRGRVGSRLSPLAGFRLTREERGIHTPGGMGPGLPKLQGAWEAWVAPPGAGCSGCLRAGPCVQASPSTARQTQDLTSNPLFCPWARPGAQVPASVMKVWGPGQGSCC